MKHDKIMFTVKNHAKNLIPKCIKIACQLMIDKIPREHEFSFEILM